MDYNQDLEDYAKEMLTNKSKIRMKRVLLVLAVAVVVAVTTSCSKDGCDPSYNSVKVNWYSDYNYESDKSGSFWVENCAIYDCTNSFDMPSNRAINMDSGESQTFEFGKSYKKRHANIKTTTYTFSK